MKIKKIIACADIHIRNFLRQEEYGIQLTKFIEMCREIASHYNKDEVRIVIAGDLLHQKNNISPELISLVSAFIRQLEQIAKVLVIAGNHDLLENNKTRKDAISSIFETASFENTFFLDALLSYESGCVEDENIIWQVYSIYNDYAKPNDMFDKENKKHIALYHGMIVGAALDNGSVVDVGVDGDLFDKSDLVIAGHIHKRQKFYRGRVPVVYCGSLIQQTYGETVTQHGFVVVDVETMDAEFIDLPTTFGLYNIEINDIQDIDDDIEHIVNY